jgi:hypothetical protein
MSTADEIAKLHELLRQGSLTQDEFERAKAGLLAGVGAPLTLNPLRRPTATAGLPASAAALRRQPAWSPGSGAC